MAEGSTVKLGERGVLMLENLRMQRKENVFSATMDVSRARSASPPMP